MSADKHPLRKFDPPLSLAPEQLEEFNTLDELLSTAMLDLTELLEHSDYEHGGAFCLPGAVIMQLALINGYSLLMARIVSQASDIAIPEFSYYKRI